MNKSIINSFKKQKVEVSKLCMICALLLVFSGCENQNNNEFVECEYKIPQYLINGTVANCHIHSFFTGISMFSKCSNAYIIKGNVLGKDEYGHNIRFIEDLKGNFPKNKDTFIALGSDGNSFLYDNFDIYNVSDVLIMHLIQADMCNNDYSPGIPWPDYCTFICTASVLTLSSDSVKGIIQHKKNGHQINTMPIDDFQKELKKILKSNKQKT